MNTYADKLVDSILDGTRPLESIDFPAEMVKIGMAFARDAIKDAEAADDFLMNHEEAVINNDDDD